MVDSWETGHEGERDNDPRRDLAKAGIADAYRVDTQAHQMLIWRISKPNLRAYFISQLVHRCQTKRKYPRTT